MNKNVFEELGISDLGEIQENELILKDSDDYSEAYSRIYKNPELELDKSNVLVSENVGELTYSYKNFKVKLVYNFSDDMYKVIVKDEDDE